MTPAERSEWVRALATGAPRLTGEQIVRLRAVVARTRRTEGERDFHPVDVRQHLHREPETDAA